MPAKLTHNYVVEEFKKLEIKVLDQYISINKKILCECKNNHMFYATPSNTLKFKTGCPICKGINSAKKQLFPYERIFEKAKERGFVLLNDKAFWENNHPKIEIQCKYGHVTKSTSHAFFAGSGCNQCGKISSAKKRKKDPKIVTKQILKAGYVWVGEKEEYKNSKTKLTIKCLNDHIFKINANDILGGHGCPYCSGLHSKGETEIYNFIKELNVSVSNKNRDIIKPKELDICCPDQKLAIEFCGEYWHSDKFLSKKYHFEKTTLCQTAGYDLITIFEQEWKERKESIKSFLSAKLNISKKLFARKLIIKEIEPLEAKTFIDKFHVQKYKPSLLAVGLFDKDVLVAAATLGLHHRNKKELVLNRLCFGEYKILGGASKMLKTLRALAKSAGHSKIVTWSDNRWSSGNVYLKIGFTKVSNIRPDYFYFDKKNSVIKSKQSCQKKNLLALGAKGNTESEMAKSLGYFKVWDCGKIKWEILTS